MTSPAAVGSRSRAIGGALIGALALWAVFAVVAVWLRPPMPVDETRYLSVAWEMWRTGDLLVPHLNGATYSHKPPVLFWAINLAWAIFGVSETVARLVPPALAALSLPLAAAIARLAWPADARAPGRAALLTAATLGFAASGSMVMFDATLTTTSLVGVLGVVWTWRRGGVVGWLLVAIGIGLGILTKGPVALLHILPVAVLAPLWMTDDRPTSWLRWYAGAVVGTALGAAIALAWVLPAASAGGQAYADAILWGQTAGRVVEAFDHGRPWWFYIPVLPAILYPLAWWPGLWRTIKAHGLRVFDSGERMVLAWLVATVIVFSFVSGKQPHYLLPELAAAALFFAHRLSSIETAARGDRAISALLPLIVGVALAAAPLLAGVIASPRTAAFLGAIQPWATVLPLGVAALLLTRRGRMLPPVAVPVLVTAGLFLGVHAAASDLLARYYDLRPLAARLGEDRAAPIAITRTYHGEFSFLARLERPVEEIAEADAAAWLAANPDGRVIVRGSQRPAPIEGGRAVVESPYRGGFIALVESAADGRE